uniref:Uncharacterized protein n=1 Tax=Cacopsylla melanoneura TaxID=428564 RepID=A0A8D9AG37_9HEMI
MLGEKEESSVPSPPVYRVYSVLGGGEGRVSRSFTSSVSLCTPPCVRGRRDHWMMFSFRMIKWKRQERRSSSSSSFSSSSLFFCFSISSPPHTPPTLLVFSFLSLSLIFSYISQEKHHQCSVPCKIG